MEKETKELIETKKKPGGAKKAFKIVGNVLMWLFIIAAIVVTILAFSAQSSSDGIPTVGGKVMSPVLSPSMEPTINKGDIIFTRKLSDEEKLELKKDTIITYKALNDDGSTYINTHRIIEVINEGESSVEYKTQGDNNEYPDSYTVRPSDVVSIYVEGEDTRIPVLGNVINFLLQPTGFFFVIVIPLIIFFLFEIIVFVKKLMEVKNSDKKKISAADEELIKQKAIEEYLRAQQLEKEAEDANAEAAAEEKKAEPVDAPPAEAPAEEAPTEEIPSEEAPAEDAPAKEE